MEIAKTRWILFSYVTQAVLNGDQDVDPELVSSEEYLGYCRYHRIVSRIYPVLKPLLTEDGHARFKRAVEKAVQASFTKIKELKLILQALAQDEIPVLLIKGLSLSHLLYDSYTMRDSSDIDIVVPENNVKQAEHALSHIGYFRTIPEGALTERQQRFFQKHFKDFSFKRKGILSRMELHWCLHPGFGLKGYKLWANVKEGSFFNLEVKTLDTVDYFIYLCVHGTNSMWRRWSWLLDARDYYLKFKEQLDEKIIFKRAQEQGVLSSVLQADIILHKMFFMRITKEKWSFKMKCFHLMTLRELKVLQKTSKRVLSEWLRCHFFKFFIFPKSRTMPYRLMFHFVVKRVPL